MAAAAMIVATALHLAPKQHQEVVAVYESLEINEKRRWTSDKLNANEKKVLNFLQDEGITDKMALAVVMGNIKQESLFIPNICEGGARVNYSQCHRGGFGLIQWTTENRYDGLGKFARNYGGDPTSLDTQLRYMVNEVQWQNAVKTFKKEGLSLHQYMSAAYRWLGWGVHGQRTHYSMNYYNILTNT